MMSENSTPNGSISETQPGQYNLADAKFRAANSEHDPKAVSFTGEQQDANKNIPLKQGSYTWELLKQAASISPNDVFMAICFFMAARYMSILPELESDDAASVGAICAIAHTAARVIGSSHQLAAIFTLQGIVVHEEEDLSIRIEIDNEILQHSLVQLIKIGVICATIAAAFLLFIPSLYRWLGTPQNIVDVSQDYVNIAIFSLYPQILNIGFQQTLLKIGKKTRLLQGAFLNLFTTLGSLLIFMHVAGPLSTIQNIALAFVIGGWTTSAFYSIYLMYRQWWPTLSQFAHYLFKDTDISHALAHVDSENLEALQTLLRDRGDNSLEQTMVNTILNLDSTTHDYRKIHISNSNIETLLQFLENNNRKDIQKIEYHSVGHELLHNGNNIGVQLVSELLAVDIMSFYASWFLPPEYLTQYFSIFNAASTINFTAVVPVITFAQAASNIMDSLVKLWRKYQKPEHLDAIRDIAHVTLRVGLIYNAILAVIITALAPSINSLFYNRNDINIPGISSNPYIINMIVTTGLMINSRRDLCLFMQRSLNIYGLAAKTSLLALWIINLPAVVFLCKAVPQLQLYVCAILIAYYWVGIPVGERILRYKLEKAIQPEALRILLGPNTPEQEKLQEDINQVSYWKIPSIMWKQPAVATSSDITTNLMHTDNPIV